MLCCGIEYCFEAVPDVSIKLHVFTAAAPPESVCVISCRCLRSSLVYVMSAVDVLLVVVPVVSNLSAALVQWSSRLAVAQS